MKHKYLVIADEDTVLGFKCAGVPGIVATSRPEALRALQEARERKVGIIILTEEVALMARAEVDEVRFSKTLPMVVEIPGPRGPIPGKRGLSQVIRETVGIKV